MPRLEYDELHKMVLSGEVGAVSIDTSTFRQYQYHLISGVLSRVGLIAESGLRCIITSIMYFENLKHFSELIDKARGSVRQYPDILIDYFGHGDEVRAAIDVSRCSAVHCQNSAKKIFDSYITKHCISVISCDDYVDIESIIYGYQNSVSPFAQKDKKCEFPDAISLCAVEVWAEENGVHVLMVSNDKDVLQYCNCSERLHYVKDMPEAIRLVASKHDTESIKELVIEYLEHMRLDRSSGFYETLLEKLNDNAWKIDITVETTSGYRHDEDAAIDSITDICFSCSDKDEIFTVVDYDRYEITVLASAVLTVDVTVDFRFYVWDSIDREEIPLSSRSISRSGIETSAEIFITLKSDFHNTSDYIDVGGVDISSAHVSVEFGELSPFTDWED